MNARGTNLFLRSIRRANRTRAVPRRSPNAHCIATCIATSPLQCQRRSADRAGAASGMVTSCAELCLCGRPDRRRAFRFESTPEHVCNSPEIAS
jgi:hypothetical protein